jgi:hypothetical protein
MIYTPNALTKLAARLHTKFRKEALLRKLLKSLQNNI